MAIDAKKWLEDAARDAGLPDDVAKALLSNDKLLGKVGEGVMLRSDYSRSQDQLTAEKSAAEAAQRKWYADNQTVVDQYAASLTAYEQKYGKLDANNGGNNGGGNFDPSKYVSTADYQKALDKAANDAYQRAVSTNVTITKEAIRAANDYSRRFGKDLDLDALEKYALEKQLPLRQAYTEFISAEATAKADADETARIDKAVSERVAAELSKHNLPGENSTNEPHVLFDRLNAPPDQHVLTEREQLASFTEAWNSAPAK